jgi:hypothetical protein
MHSEGQLSCWLFVRCSVCYITKDGRSHNSSDYPEAFVGA